MCGTFTVASELLTTLTFMSFSELISKVYLDGSFFSADSISALWYLQLLHVIEKRETLPKYGTSTSSSVNSSVFSRHKGQGCPVIVSGFAIKDENLILFLRFSIFANFPDAVNLRRALVLENLNNQLSRNPLAFASIRFLKYQAGKDFYFLFQLVFLCYLKL